MVKKVSKIIFRLTARMPTTRFFGEQRGGQRPAFTISLESVKEFQVVPVGASAEFGRASGGFINVVTKIRNK